MMKLANASALKLGKMKIMPVFATEAANGMPFSLMIANAAMMTIGTSQHNTAQH
ncbi:hypothetical protein [Deefgea piscis]|uniref:hypothetical protein n=1 Tax=Deefgea piscis TaxID=2739061 RepID=UPI002102F1EA|nr:hypothetical protein [Deefgea piscis]